MKCSVALCVVSATLFVALCSAGPVPAADELQLVQIPLQGNKEIDILSVADNAGQSNDRNKRTIGILRELFPELSKASLDGADADSVDMAALSQKLESISRVVRQTQAAAAAADVSAAADPNSAAAVAAEVLQTAASDSSAQASVQLEAAKAPAIDELSLDDEGTEDNRNKRFLNFGFGGSAGAGGSGAAGGGSGNFLFDIIRATQRTADQAARAAGTVYRVVAGTESLDTYGVAKTNSAAAAAAGRTTSTISRLTTTTRQLPQQSDPHHYTGVATARQYLPSSEGSNSHGLVSGSSGTEQTDEKENAPEADAAKGAGDGYTEGIPGPVTRLIVLANRGLSNLIQDLILRIAATSERVVNFKARLITSLI